MFLLTYMNTCHYVFSYPMNIGNESEAYVALVAEPTNLCAEGSGLDQSWRTVGEPAAFNEKQEPEPSEYHAASLAEEKA